jgi:hypothetical protein
MERKLNAGALVRDRRAWQKAETAMRTSHPEPSCTEKWCAYHSTRRRVLTV